jgi:hypothetical protein
MQYVRYLKTRHWKNIATRVIFLNAMVPPAGPMYLLVEPAAPTAAAGLVAEILRHGRPYASFVGHGSTAAALSKLFGVDIPTNRGEYTPRSGDLAVVARLKSRPPIGADVEVHEEDLQFLLVWYLEGAQ